MYNLNLQSIDVFWHINQLVLQIFDRQFMVDLSEVTQQLNKLNFNFWQTYDNSYQYSEPINAFVQSVLLTTENQHPSQIVWDSHNTALLLNQLSLYISSIQAYRLQQFNQEVHNRNTLYNYLNNLIQHYARLLFVRVDLSYLEDFRQFVTLEDFHTHLSKLLQQISNKKTCFENLQGYCWAIEQGSDKSIHVHLLLMYDGQKRQNDYGMGLLVGEKWIKITEGYGCYYNCNNADYKGNFINDTMGINNLGIGMIHRDNPQEVTNAINTGLYLAKPEKSDQYCCIKLPNARTFGTGQYNVAWRRGIYQ